MPKRFEGSDISYRGQHFELIPFGAGRRICPGMQKGIFVVEIALSNMLYHFNLKTPCETSHKDIDTTETLGVFLHKKSPLVLQATSIET
ncbi:putative oxidoreductase [Dioscorea sansibarensis]